MAGNKKETMTSCWSTPELPSPKLLESLKAGPFKGAGLDELVARLRRESLSKPVVFVGTGTCGLGAGAGKTIGAVRAYAKKRKADLEVVEVGCIGLCSVEPLMDVQLPGRTRLCFSEVDEKRAPAILDAVLKGKLPAGGALGQFDGEGLQAWDGVPYLRDNPFLAPQRRVVLAGSGIVDPGDIDEYIARGGYSSLAKVLKGMTPEQVCDAVEQSGLRGRGGGGFPTGKKWKFARASKSDEKYLICNADEGDPGAFMDRAVGESDPHRLLEGMVIAAYGIGATKAYIYIRAEYPVAIDRLVAAMAKAKEYGLLGKDILGTGFGLEIVIKKGAGAFVCGEETALMHSVEGKRGMPRPRPPYPAAKGLFGKPTVINNVETLANLPGIMEMGAAAYAAMGTKGSKGTKVFALSGMVERTGLVEIPMGTTIRDIVYTIGGGSPRGRRCKAVQIGGPSGGCIPEPNFDVPTDYEALKDFGAIMGSGGLVVMDETTCMVDLAKYFMEFIQSESCGKCIPCREGTRRMLEILKAITRPRRKEAGQDALLRFQGTLYLEKLARTIKDTSLCGLGQTAPNPVLSTLRWFRDEYEAHVYERRCPAGSCKELVGAPCANTCPVETEVWRYVAHVARGEHEEAYRIVRQANPLPISCARVCHHPCEKQCRCGTTGGDPIAVRTLKRFLVDRVPASAFKPEVRKAGKDAKRVAVVGAGPSGLTAGHLLSALGHKVTVYEREKKAGGMLVCAIPEYRLPRERLAQEVKNLLNPNLEVRYGKELGKGLTLDGLLKDHDAVYLAVGSHSSRKLGLAGEDAQGIHHGIAFLKAYNLHGRELASGRVGVVGGGNSAVDAARVAVRQKGVKEVTVFYRRALSEMPAYKEEVEAAREEGVKFVPLVAPTKVLAEGGRLKGVEFIRNEPGAKGADGRQGTVPVAGSEHEEALDTLVIAISESPELSGLDKLEASKRGGIAADPGTLQTSRVGVFAGGDAVRGPNTVVDAIADGKRGAAMIDRFLTGRQLVSIPKVRLPGVFVEPAKGPDGEPAAGAEARVRCPHLAAAARRKNHREVELVVSEAAAVAEARRCLRCDLEFTQGDPRNASGGFRG